uniref:Bm12000 n=1 Tax=Brugia malayi TaxID=6279 RepID=A0A1I9GAG4_BRUMA|nr:Bm12000 [Brugia malayi]
MPDLNFTDRVVIVTGAGGSLGKAYALEFAKRGASVVVNDLGTIQDGSFARSLSANTTVAEIKFHGGKAVPNFDSVVYGHKIIEAAIEHFGRIGRQSPLSFLPTTTGLLLNDAELSTIFGCDLSVYCWIMFQSDK